VGSIGREYCGPTHAQGKKHEPYLKNNSSKKGLDMTQGDEVLLNKHKALSSTPSTAPKRKQKPLIKFNMPS
jgi:hypothetical protein